MQKLHHLIHSGGAWHKSLIMTNRVSLNGKVYCPVLIRLAAFILAFIKIEILILFFEG